MGEGLAFGRYHLRGLLGRGGMGEVWLAEARGVGAFRKAVVIKRVAPELAASEAFRARFLAEGALAVSLSHPNIVQVFDLGDEGGEPFLAMEHVDGWDLSTVLTGLEARGERLPPPLALRVLCALAEALGYAHRRGVIHRDVSPGNVMLDRHGAIKLVDFGVAALAGAATSGLKVAWASPEQLRGEVAAAPSDVFSLGVLAWTLLAGVHPYRGLDDASTRRGLMGAWRWEGEAAWRSALLQLTAVIVDERLADGDAAARILRELAATLGPVPGPEELGDWLSTRLSADGPGDASFDTLLVGSLSRGDVGRDRTLTRAPVEVDGSTRGAPSDSPAARALPAQLRRLTGLVGLGLLVAAIPAVVTSSTQPERVAVPGSPVPALAESVPVVEASERHEAAFTVEGLPKVPEVRPEAPPAPPEAVALPPEALPAVTARAAPRTHRAAGPASAGRFEPRPGRVRFRVLPASARLVVDGLSVSHGGGVIELALPAGAHQLRIESLEGQVLERRFALAPDERLNLRTLEVPP
jgi:serine/threonine protein kinase